jgi:hypothetical protein
MRIYRFWLDQLPKHIADELIDDNQVSKMWIKKEFNTWLKHGDFQEMPQSLQGMNRGVPDYAKSGATNQPTAVEIPDTYSKLPWILLTQT